MVARAIASVQRFDFFFLFSFLFYFGFTLFNILPISFILRKWVLFYQQGLMAQVYAMVSVVLPFKKHRDFVFFNM